MTATQFDRLHSDLVVGIAIARGTVSDRIRRHMGSRREKALFALVALVSIPVILFFIQSVYTAGVLTRDGVDAPVVEAARNLLVPILLVTIVIAGLESIQQLGSKSVRPLLLTSAPTRAIVIGKVLSLLFSWLVLVGLGFVFLVAYALGARTPLFVIAVVLAGVPLFVLVLLAGLSLGYLLWLGVERVGLSEGFRQLLTAALYIVIFAGMFAGGTLVGEGAAGGVDEFLPTGEPVVPLGWYADLLFVGSPMATTIGLDTVIAAGLVFALIPASFAVLVRLAPMYWYMTPTEADDAEGESAASASRELPSASIGRISHPVFGSSRTLRAALGYLRGGIRQPGQFVYLFYYLFPIAPVIVQQAVDSPGTLPPVLGASLIVLGVWFAGGIFCLNPLGAEGTMLTQLVLATAPTETYIHARLLVGAFVGVLFAVPGLFLLTATSSLVTPAIAAVATPLVFGTILGSAGFALGIGAVLPRFESVEIFESVETLAPSLFAAIVHAVLATVFLLTAAGLAVATAFPGTPLSLPERLFGLVVFALVIAAITDGSRRYAIARLRDYGRTAPRTDRPFAIYLSFALAVLAFLLGQAISITAVLVFGIDAPMEVLLPLLFLVEYLGYALVALGFLYVTRRGWSYLDVHRPTPREYIVVLLGLVASLGLWAMASVAVTELGLPAADHALFDPEDAGSPELLLVLIPLMILVNGPIEELLYRNVIQKYLAERFHEAIAVGVASLVFALAHVPVYLTAGVGPLLVTLGMLLLVSTLWGVIYARTESLLVVAAIHGLYNATLVFILYLTIV